MKAHAAPSLPRRPAAQYLRASTDHQRYSTEHQAAAIAQYAHLHHYELVRTYADEGISGVSIKRRAGLQKLLADVVSDLNDYDIVLVYDVSRWGRFQNPDQSAHYEFLCAEAGVQIEYCAELFPNDGSLSSTLLKSLRRVMAAEYSRDLSTKVSRAQRKLLTLGYWQGGSAGYGLRRQMVDPQGRRGPVLEYGQGKAIHGHHVILVPGPDAEIAIVQRIYRLFIDVGLTIIAITRLLNEERIISENGDRWTHHTVRQVLTSRKYLGELIGHRTTALLGGRPTPVPKAEWIRKPKAFEPIVSVKLFKAAQAVFAARRPKMSRAEMIAVASQIHAEHGTITYKLIESRPGIAGSFSFRAKIGNADALRAAIGQPSGRPRRPCVMVDDDEALRRLAALYGREGYLSTALINADPKLPGASTYAVRFGGIKGAYARVGFVALTPAELNSPVGRARLAAVRARLVGPPGGRTAPSAPSDVPGPEAGDLPITETWGGRNASSGVAAPLKDG